MYILFIVQWILDEKQLPAFCVLDAFLQLPGIYTTNQKFGVRFFKEINTFSEQRPIKLIKASVKTFVKILYLYFFIIL